MTEPAPKVRKRKWSKRSLWIFIVVNILGLVLIFPVLPTIMPLVRIWWDTRSQESFEQQNQPGPSEGVTDFTEGGISGDAAEAPHQPVDNTGFSGLTNQLDVVQNLDSAELDKIVALQFGPKPELTANTGVFDRDSAVFHSIKKTMPTLEGKQYHCYEVDLVDQNGLHQVHMDCYEEPDLDYERSMATLQLVNQNPQLKKIYDAFSHLLGEQSSTSTNEVEEPSGGNKPAFRIEHPQAVPEK
jgi:hypothetical protein